jgi:hypothetical protein
METIDLLDPISIQLCKDGSSLLYGITYTTEKWAMAAVFVHLPGAPQSAKMDGWMDGWPCSMMVFKTHHLLSAINNSI